MMIARGIVNTFVFLEYADTVGDVDDKITRDLERQRLLSLLSKL